MPIEASWIHNPNSIQEWMILTMSTALLALALVWFVGADGFSSFFRRPKLVRVESRQWWADLAPPFAIEQQDDETREDWDHDAHHAVHFCFLIHGHRGLSKDLSYLQTVMESLSEQEKRKRFKQDGLPQDIIVHSAVCNEGKTTDGVANGGERLVEEMLATIASEMKNRKARHVTISVVGNSLGGIYGRYAIAKLAQQEDWNLHYNIFCTTATPHLGVSKHTYLPLPRTAEIGVAHALGNTGKDLFRLNDLMKIMATSEEFISPLGAFRKRIAYANAYGTDFPVPAETAAFLSDQSTYPHHFSVEDDSCVVVDRDSGLVIATLHTPPKSEDDMIEISEHTDELVQMSTALDALGWKKVFVDLRTGIPLRVSLPKRLGRINSSFSSSNTVGDSSSSSEEEVPPAAPLHALRQKGGVVESRHLASAVKSEDPNDPYHRLHLPIGHNMIVAFSRSRMSAYVNKAGRPVVDALAKELVKDIFSWNEHHDEKTE